MFKNWCLKYDLPVSAMSTVLTRNGCYV